MAKKRPKVLIFIAWRWLGLMLTSKPILSIDLYALERNVGIIGGWTNRGQFRIRWHYLRSQHLRVIVHHSGYLVGKREV